MKKKEIDKIAIDRMPKSLSYEDSCRALQKRGIIAGPNLPPSPAQMPRYDDEMLVKGSPIKAGVNGKIVVRPRFFLRVHRAPLSDRFQANSSLRFRRLIPDPVRGDPFSHPSGSSAWVELDYQLRTERNQQVALAWFPPARFLGHPFLRPAAHSCQAAHRAPTAGTAAARKRSVPGRVHSVYKNFGWSRGYAAANPLWTHGTVESPAKLSFVAQLANRSVAASNQS